MSMLLIYMWFVTQWTTQYLKDVSLPKIVVRLPPDIYFFYRECGLASPGAQPFFRLANNGIMVMAAGPHKL